MTVPGHDRSDSWQGLAIMDCDHQPLGRIDDVYRDRATGQPEWMLVHADAPDAPAVFVPVHQASKEGEAVVVPYDRALVERAPGVPSTSELSEADEARLYDHYGISYSGERSASGLPAGTGPSEGEAPYGEPPAGDGRAAEPPRPPERRAAAIAVPAGLAGLAALAAAGVAVGAVILRRRRRDLSPLERAVEQARRAAQDMPRAVTAGPAAGLRRQVRRQAPRALARTMTGAVVLAARSGAAAATTRNRATTGVRLTRQALGQGTRTARQAARYRARDARRTARITGVAMRGARRDLTRRAPSPRRFADGLRHRRARSRRSLRFGALAGAAAGYLMGTRAGRERYEQLAAAARRVSAEPSASRLKTEATELFRAQRDRAAAAAGETGDRAADRPGEARATTGQPPEPGPGGTGTDPRTG